jgi:hypothetical protein
MQTRELFSCRQQAVMRKLFNVHLQLSFCIAIVMLTLILEAALLKDKINILIVTIDPNLNLSFWHILGKCSDKRAVKGKSDKSNFTKYNSVKTKQKSEPKDLMEVKQ